MKWKRLPEWIRVWPSVQWTFLCLKYRRAESFRTVIIIEVVLKRAFSSRLSIFSVLCLFTGSHREYFDGITILLREKKPQYSRRAFLRHRSEQRRGKETTAFLLISQNALVWANSAHTFYLKPRSVILAAPQHIFSQQFISSSMTPSEEMSQGHLWYYIWKPPASWRHAWVHGLASRPRSHLIGHVYVTVPRVQDETSKIYRRKRKEKESDTEILKKAIFLDTNLAWNKVNEKSTQGHTIRTRTCHFAHHRSLIIKLKPAAV